MNASIAGGLSARLGPRTGLTASIISSRGNPVKNGLVRQFTPFSGSLGQLVSVWRDISSAGMDATQPTMAKQPMLASGQNGRNCVQFDGVSTLLQGVDSDLPAGSSARTGFAYCNLDLSSIEGAFAYGVSSVNSGCIVAQSTSGVIYSRFGNDISTNATSGWHVIRFVETGTSAELYVDGVSSGSGSAANTVLGSLFIGSSLGSTLLWSNKIQAITLYDRQLSDLECSAEEAWLPFA